MRMDNSDIAELRRIKLADMISYLRSTGWRRVKYTDTRTTVFAKEDEEEERPFLVTLPAKEQFTDYASRMAEAIMRLADIEEVSFDAVLQKIQAVGQDVIYLRLTLGHNEFPSLESTSHFIEGMRNLVTYGACMEREQRRYFEQPFHEGREQAQHFQFAHTFQGSFGFTIESQIVEQHPLWTGYEPIPLQRKVLERITRGFLFAHQAEQTHNPDEISEHFAQGFNANMCKAVLEMLEDIRNGQVAYAVRWSAHLKPSEDVAQVEPITLGQDTSYYLQRAATTLERTAARELRGERTIEGVITNLGFDGRGEREVIMMVEGFGKVSFVLDADDYIAAGLAHLKGQTVHVIGRLTRSGKRGPFTLTSPRNFQVNQ